MITQRTKVDGLGEYATSVGNLVTNVRDLRGNLASVREEALARLVTSGTANIGKTEGTGVAVEFDYIRGASPVAVKYDRLGLQLAKKAVEANSRNQYHCTDSTRRYDKNAKTAEQEEKSGVLPEERTAILLPRDSFSMSPEENPSHFAFFLEDLSKTKDGKCAYIILNKGPIQVYPIDKAIVDGKRDSQLLENPNGTIVVPYGWFGSLGGRSVLSGYDRGAGGCYYGTRGVLNDAPKAPQKSSKPISLGYTLREAEQYLRILNGVRSGNLAPTKLEKLISFFSRKQ